MSQINKYKKIFENEYFLRNGEMVSMSTNPVFDGGGVKRVSDAVLKYVEANKGCTVLDYGCGNAIHWHKRVQLKQDLFATYTEFLGPNMSGFYRYDPAHPIYNKRPNGRYDLIVCTDVLEHVPIDEMPAVLEEIASYMLNHSEAIFSIPKKESKNAFRDGENMHCTLMSFDEWAKLISKHIPKKKISIFHYD